MVKNTLVNVNPHFVGFNPYISGLSIWLLTTYDLWDDPPSIAMVIWEVHVGANGIGCSQHPRYV